MDPLTIRLEEALHGANASDPTGPATNVLIAALRDAVAASPHRVRGPVRVDALGATRIELCLAERRYVLELGEGGWRRQGTRDAPLSGPLAAALTRWLTDGA